MTGVWKATLPSSIRQDPMSPSVKKMKEVDYQENRGEAPEKADLIVLVQAESSSRTRKTRGVRNPCLLLELSPDLIVRILARLPLKSIFRCKVVCKQWKHILSDPYFSDIYSKNPPFTTFLLPVLRLCPYQFYSYGCTIYYLIEIFEDGDRLFKTAYKPRLPKSLSKSIIEDACNGLYLLTSKEDGVVHILNPIMMGSDSILTLQRPISKIEKHSSLKEYNMLGYSSAVNRFKVLKLLFYWSSSGDYKLKVLIFSLGVDDGWRCLPDIFQIEDEPSDFVPGVILNGVYHWVSKNEDNECVNTFDLGDEKPNFISWPYRCPTIQEYVYCEEVKVFNGRLSLVQYLEPHPDLTIWTMKEYGVTDSWTQIQVSNRYLPFEITPKEEFIPLEILGNGVIVFLCGRVYGAKKLRFYDPGLKKITKIEYLNSKFDGTKISYAPSFAPLCKPINGVI